eukprot:scaffold2408_cov279-Chaetoceros_neogracile.AAC.15
MVSRVRTLSATMISTRQGELGLSQQQNRLITDYNPCFSSLTEAHTKMLQRKVVKENVRGILGPGDNQEYISQFIKGWFGNDRQLRKVCEEIALLRDRLESLTF